jgi:hypothetical protein
MQAALRCATDRKEAPPPSLPGPVLGPVLPDRDGPWVSSHGHRSEKTVPFIKEENPGKWPPSEMVGAAADPSGQGCGLRARGARGSQGSPTASADDPPGPVMPWALDASGAAARQGRSSPQQWRDASREGDRGRRSTRTVADLIVLRSLPADMRAVHCPAWMQQCWGGGSRHGAKRRRQE